MNARPVAGCPGYADLEDQANARLSGSSDECEKRNGSRYQETRAVGIWSAIPCSSDVDLAGYWKDYHRNPVTHSKMTRRCDTSLDNFTHWLRKRCMAPEYRIPHLVRWVERFARLSTSLPREAWSDTLRVFLPETSPHLPIRLPDIVQESAEPLCIAPGV
jgi:hypothetical protein